MRRRGGCHSRQISRSLSEHCGNGLRLRDLSVCMHAYYEIALCGHFVISHVLKAILFDELLTHEHCVFIGNVSGPPNIGKSFACAHTLVYWGLKVCFYQEVQ